MRVRTMIKTCQRFGYNMTIVKLAYYTVGGLSLFRLVLSRSTTPSWLKGSLVTLLGPWALMMRQLTMKLYG